MQSEPDGDYKFILNYQDYLTKFVVLRPQKTKTADEVADDILDIFCLLGAPNVLHGDNGSELCNKFEEEISCFECAEYIHSTCTSAPQSEIPLCHLLANKSVIENSRKHCKRGLQEHAEMMLQTSRKKFPPASTGDNTLVSIPDVDRGRLAPRNVLAVIMEEVEPNLFSIGTKHGKLEKLYSINEFSASS
ncbi:hypothetical protein PR048_005962 [Dryococelus australis]|uniref:Integrase catalytic domain-containing protein n=1 Tax=Dryococelus australis TaxID=614101 RepID=A0ABQ9I9Q7_9NEOP|nr:hypothetical protein PR048_005962 [Dryococelus australis]